MKCPICQHKLSINRKQINCPQCHSRFTSKINVFRAIIFFIFALLITNFTNELCKMYQVAWYIDLFVFVVVLAALVIFYKACLESWIQTIEKVD